MTEAYWVLALIGDVEAIKRDIETFPPLEGAAITYKRNEVNGWFQIGAHDTALGGRDKMPYPNQIAFLDHLIEADGFKAGQYQFVDAPIFLDWTIEDYIATKSKEKGPKRTPPKGRKR